jgi:DNA adenine methylase
MDPPAQVEVFNDADHCVMNFYDVIRNHTDAFKKLVSTTPYHEGVFKEVAATPRPSKEQLAEMSTKDKIKEAWRCYVLSRLSIGGRGTGWSYTRHRARRGMADVVSGWLSSIDEQLDMIVDRLRQVQFTDGWDVVKFLEYYNSKNTLFYLDPPYLKDTRVGDHDVYGVEMSREKHTEMCEWLASSKNKSKVILSGYANDPEELYDTVLEGWYYDEIEIANHAAGGTEKRRMMEGLWLNYQ